MRERLMGDYAKSRIQPFQSSVLPKWAVQELMMTGFLWWRKPRWVTVGEFFSREDAERELRAIREEGC